MRRDMAAAIVDKSALSCRSAGVAGFSLRQIIQQDLEEVTELGRLIRRLDDPVDSRHSDR